MCTKNKETKTLNITFVGIDFWGRPGYKVEDMNAYVGSVDTIFPNKDIAPNGTKEEIDTYFKEHLNELVLFGSTFDEDHDPLGTKVKKTIKLNIL